MKEKTASEDNGDYWQTHAPHGHAICHTEQNVLHYITSVI
jgi:hypothetical protein